MIISEVRIVESNRFEFNVMLGTLIPFRFGGVDRGGGIAWDIAVASDFDCVWRA